MKCLIHPFFLVSLTLLAPSSALAQQPSRSSAGELADTLRSADSGDWYLRITAADVVVEGRVRDLDERSVRLAGGELALVDIDRIERRRTSGSGALVGAVAGGVIFGGLGLVVSAFCDQDCGRAVFGAVTAGVAFGATVGGLLGAVLAPGETSWEELWRGWP